MNDINLDEYKLSIIDLAQQWKLGIIDPQGYAKINQWYSALSVEQLGPPIGVNVENVEMWLNRLTFKPGPPIDKADLNALWEKMKNPDDLP